MRHSGCQAGRAFCQRLYGVLTALFRAVLAAFSEPFWRETGSERGDEFQVSFSRKRGLFSGLFALRRHSRRPVLFPENPADIAGNRLCHRQGNRWEDMFFFMYRYAPSTTGNTPEYQGRVNDFGTDQEGLAPGCLRGISDVFRGGNRGLRTRTGRICDISQRLGNTPLPVPPGEWQLLYRSYTAAMAEDADGVGGTVSLCCSVSTSRCSLSTSFYAKASY